VKRPVDQHAVTPAPPASCKELTTGGATRSSPVCSGSSDSLPVSCSWSAAGWSGQVFLWLGLFIATLFGQAGSAGGVRRQFFAVPGGVVYRKLRRRSRDWHIHLFKRAQSVLCVYRMAKGQ